MKIVIENRTEKIKQKLWVIVYLTVFYPTPKYFYRWRALLLKLFGAKIGSGVIIYPTAFIRKPWKLRILANSTIGHNVDVFNVDEIVIGENVVISNNTILCTASHDYSKKTLPLIADKIEIKNNVWITSHCFIAPGCVVEEGCVVLSRSTLLKSTNPYGVYGGYPARRLKDRILVD